MEISDTVRLRQLIRGVHCHSPGHHRPRLFPSQAEPVLRRRRRQIRPINRRQIRPDDHSQLHRRHGRRRQTLPHRHSHSFFTPSSSDRTALK
ncbi:unnamed protein product [Cuscuta epithymum]|uniref:Uncharacterized protein n=1 Tax=Cuscuta epithymum TaxID=186058 RepID=A0AAV0EAJ1_9ASTE|nr:unnamed protein product [Cuscuta epithymum]